MRRSTLSISLSLPVRTWATLDTALSYFRSGPTRAGSARKLAKHCQSLHELLKLKGVKGTYRSHALAGTERLLCRLHVASAHAGWDSLDVDLPLSVARSIAKACLALLEVHSRADLGIMLDHEAEELQAMREYFGALRQQGYCPVQLVGNGHGKGKLRWHEDRGEYLFMGRVAGKLQRHYLHVGAGVN